MRNTTAYYLLIFYSIAMCKPILPLIGDVLAHAFWQQEHISKVHIENGKDHLHNEMVNAGKENEKEKQISKLSESVSVHLPITFLNNELISSCLINYQPFLIQNLSNPIKLLQIPPPKA